MIALTGIVRTLKNDRRGVTALEYGMIASVLFGTILVGFLQLANTLSQQFIEVSNHL